MKILIILACVLILCIWLVRMRRMMRSLGGRNKFAETRQGKLLWRFTLIAVGVMLVALAAAGFWILLF